LITPLSYCIDSHQLKIWPLLLAEGEGAGKGRRGKGGEERGEVGRIGERREKEREETGGKGMDGTSGCIFEIFLRIAYG